VNKLSIKETFKRSFFKTLTWRVLASLDTALLTWFFSGNIVTGLYVGGMEIVTKLIIYFLHERAWRIGWKKQSGKFQHSKRRSLYKAITYRTIGTLDTFILAWIFTKSATTGGYVAIAEVFTKIFIYYAHERIWDRQKIGN
tara:strand:- start:227 stop:649 length:423 start_codon:yes stop_codon:yes gene_type:complete